MSKTVQRPLIELFAVIALGACDQGALPAKPLQKSAQQAPTADAGVPRTLPSGRPASGNVTRRASPKNSR
jgi:hypothetical protein